ncbi:ATP-binding cassette domain-containing protein [Curtobacterium sp. RRHDQ10]|uniref:ATP-binding cassette domain-containing protein n=1 Tax=Curtobacterium phyllosphaerae TaxID=3413379 RepID=UPI003BF0C7F3
MTTVAPIHVDDPILDAPVISARDLGKRHGAVPIWTDVSFSIRSAETAAIVGPSGSGKSTLLHCVGLLDRVDDGRLELDGADVTRIGRAAQRHHFRMGVGHLFQNYALVENWTVDRNLDPAFIGRRIRRAERAERRASALERVGLAGAGHRKTYSMSGGEQQRIALARLLLKAPRVVVADEPSAALDDDNVAMVLSVLGEMRDAGSAIVIATHDPRVADWCDQRIDLGAAAAVE